MNIFETENARLQDRVEEAETEMKYSAEIICLACCSALGYHFCGLAWCTHRACKPWLWEKPR
ncbi:hypothetical protein LCGC14_2082290 [marine sediment metagenome]|uniref:Uncharacterized protein n=1 Tax=marine sediment metagenome TaxID=412755 RepID=A0A0F9GTJ0_9ZZZZ